MAAVVKDASAHVDASTASFAVQITGLKLGENCAVVDACYIKAADGLVYRSIGTAANEAATFAGFTPRAGFAGQAITLYSMGARFRYTAAGGLTPGQKLYIGLVAGGLDTAPTTGGTVAVARALDDTDIQCVRAIDG